MSQNDGGRGKKGAPRGGRKPAGGGSRKKVGGKSAGKSRGKSGGKIGGYGGGPRGAGPKGAGPKGGGSKGDPGGPAKRGVERSGAGRSGAGGPGAGGSRKPLGGSARGGRGGPGARGGKPEGADRAGGAASYRAGPPSKTFGANRYGPKQFGPKGPAGRGPRGGAPLGPDRKPPLRLMPTTLWEYPSQHYESWVDSKGNVHESGFGVDEARRTQGDKAYEGATPSWVIWQLLMRYTRAKDLVVDPMCGGGTTLDVARDLGRRGLGYDLAPTREDIFKADARHLPLEDEAADFVFVDPPYSTHIEYSDDPRCIGKLSAAGEDGGRPYYNAMTQVFSEIDRVLKDRRYMALYVSDSWKKRSGGPGGSPTGGEFMPIGFELFSLMRERFVPVDIITVVRHNAKLQRGNWRRAAEEGNFFLRGFNYLFIMKKVVEAREQTGRPRRTRR